MGAMAEHMCDIALAQYDLIQNREGYAVSSEGV